MAVRAVNQREFKMERLSAFLGNMMIVKINHTVNKKGEVTDSVTILSDVQADVFDVILPDAPDANAYPSGTKVDFTNVVYTVRANGRQYGQYTMGEISDEIKADTMFKASTQPAPAHTTPTQQGNK